MSLRAQACRYVASSNGRYSIGRHAVNVRGCVLARASTVTVVAVGEQTGGKDDQGVECRFFGCSPVDFIVHARTPRSYRWLLNVFGSRLWFEYQRVHRFATARFFCFYRLSSFYFSIYGCVFYLIQGLFIGFGPFPNRYLRLFGEFCPILRGVADRLTPQRLDVGRCHDRFSIFPSIGLKDCRAGLLLGPLPVRGSPRFIAYRVAGRPANFLSVYGGPIYGS